MTKQVPFALKSLRNIAEIKKSPFPKVYFTSLYLSSYTPPQTVVLYLKGIQTIWCQSRTDCYQTAHRYIKTLRLCLPMPDKENISIFCTIVEITFPKRCELL